MTVQPFSKADLDNRFDHHQHTKGSPARHDRVRAQAKRFAESLVAVVPASRELATAITHIEEAMMWASAGITRHDDDGERR